LIRGRAEKSEADEGFSVALLSSTFNRVFFDRIGEARQRFTLAHELATCSRHGSYMKAESVDGRTSKRTTWTSHRRLRHLEWQANYFRPVYFFRATR